MKTHLKIIFSIMVISMILSAELNAQLLVHQIDPMNLSIGDITHSTTVTNIGGTYTSDRNDVSNSAILFDGTADDVVKWTMNPSFDLVADHSISIWFLNNEASSVNQYILTSRRNSEGEEAGGLDVLLQKSGNIIANYRSIDSTGKIKSVAKTTYDPAIIRDVWHHLVITKKDSMMVLYLDKMIIDTAYFTENPSTTDDWAAGNITNFNDVLPRELHGAIDDIQFYEGALTATQVQDIFLGDDIISSIPHETFDQHIFPNPASTILYVESGLVEFYNNLGQNVYSTISYGQVDVSMLIEGTYILKHGNGKTSIIQIER